MGQTQISDLTVEELRTIIQEAVRQSLQEILSDPDLGAELRPEVVNRLRRSLSKSWDEDNTATAEDVAQRLGLKW